MVKIPRKKYGMALVGDFIYLFIFCRSLRSAAEEVKPCGLVLLLALGIDVFLRDYFGQAQKEKAGQPPVDISIGAHFGGT